MTIGGRDPFSSTEGMLTFLTELNKDSFKTFPEAVVALLDEIKKDPDSIHIILIDLDKTLSTGPGSTSSLIPLISFLTPVDGIIPKENMEALAQLDSATNHQVCIVTNRVDRSPLWDSQILLEKLYSELEKYKLKHIEVITGTDRSLNSKHEKIARIFTNTDRWTKLLNWIGDKRKGSSQKPIKITLISDDFPGFSSTESEYLEELQMRINNCSTRRIRISSRVF